MSLTGYYHKFVQGYDIATTPLTTLLSKDKWTWNTDTQEIFKNLKKFMISLLVL